MPNYNKPHQFYAGVDLHARSMFVHVLSAKGKTVFERDLPAEPDAFLDAGDSTQTPANLPGKSPFRKIWHPCPKGTPPLAVRRGPDPGHGHGNVARLPGRFAGV
jgi:hypothetical protein